MALLALSRWLSWTGGCRHLDDRLYGVFVGASIYELAQVYGASFAVSEGALNTATLVKLSKVLMLVPLLLVARPAACRGGDPERTRLRADAVPLVHRRASSAWCC